MAEGAEPRGETILNTYLFITGAPGKAALIPWQLTVTSAFFWSFPLDAYKGEKSCSNGSGNKGLMASCHMLPRLNFCMP